ncbi:hypothetical protein NSQ89_13055 [Niallia sp. FSL R7-0648]|uniref:hypothetical protein n=1 Tax=Niallia TaxID=2837506 RepID=UPI00148FEC19|nr:hypothetical protein [Niallia circulans]QJX63072.1 hypothetical protein HLK66_16365 [Niallia circulans]
MPYFYSKNKTIWSPQNPALEALYNFLEKHRELLEGSGLYDNLTEIYESMDEQLREEE